MSVIRYSGNVHLVLKPIAGRKYHATARYAVNAGTQWETSCERYVVVGAPACADNASLATPEAYDSAAHAALSFLADEERDIEEHAAHTDSGWHIGRTTARAWK